MNQTQKKIQKEEEQNVIILSAGTWKSSRNLEKVRKISQWGVENLVLYGNKRVQLVKDICHIHFPGLMSINLRKNQIDSIQDLASIDMPKLIHLFLENNNITSARTLRKAKWPALQSFDLSDNYISDCQAVTEGFLPKVLFASFSMPNQCGKDQFRFTFSPKMQANKLKLLWIVPELTNRRFKQSLAKKYQGLLLF